ncbi:potassium channel subfamily K member 7-like [Patiria miniata]|uniref:Potassium channel domain-containing protein n=1 Tax=Patiria miniata TaxID=46514 RepID=A0A914BE48_PATMI|nr:potassium channel subfamily K member 7-like [Patiria miniata]
MKPWKKCLLLLTALFVYLSVGAFVMIRIENDATSRAQTEFFDKLAVFVQGHYACGATPDRVLALLEKAGVASSREAFHSALAIPDSELVPVWSWPNAILFASSVVTTIGYGRQAPKTPGGQIFCLFFAILGIPLCYAMLSVVGDTFNELWKKFIRGSDRCFKAIRSKKARRVLLGVLTLTGLWMLLALLPSVIFTKTEPWDWWRAQYFCFVSLSTIGFGDLIYGQEREGDSYVLDWSYKMGILVYFFLGLSLISIVFKGVWHSQRKNLHRAHARFRRTRGQKCRSYTLRPSPPSAARHIPPAESAISNLARSYHTEFGLMDAFRRDAQGQGVTGLSYRLTVEVTRDGDCDSGHGSVNISNSEFETKI